MDDPTLPLPGLSPVAGRTVKACFDGGSLLSDAGVLVLREVDGRFGVAERLARCLDEGLGDTCPFFPLDGEAGACGLHVFPGPRGKLTNRLWLTPEGDRDFRQRARPVPRSLLWTLGAVWLSGHALFHFWEVAVGICGPEVLPRDFPAVTLPALIAVAFSVWSFRHADHR